MVDEGCTVVEDGIAVVEEGVTMTLEKVLANAIPTMSVKTQIMGEKYRSFKKDCKAMPIFSNLSPC